MGIQRGREMETMKCAVVGDGFVGKTCLLATYATDKFPSQYVPTIFDNQVVHATLSDKTVSLILWDTAGQEEYDKLRRISYPGTDVFIICFCIVNPTSLDNVLTKWHPEISRACPNKPIVLVGTKVDLRDDRKPLNEFKSNSVSYEQGCALAKRIGAAKYVECSALKQIGVAEAFEEAMRAVKSPEKTKTKRCTIL